MSGHATETASSLSPINVIVTFLVTLVLGAVLLAMLSFNAHAFSTEAVSLRWLIVALAALTLPHLVLISLCARLLSAPAGAASLER